MSTDAGSTRVSIGPRMRTLVALLVAVATFTIGAAPAVAAASGADTTHGEEVRTEIGQPASVVVNRVGRSMRDTMDGTAFTVAVIAARKFSADARRGALLAGAPAGATTTSIPSFAHSSRRRSVCEA